MLEYNSFTYPNVPPEICEILFRENKKYVIVGVIGKSYFPDCNKMTRLQILDVYPSILDHNCIEGQITFYFKKSEKVLYIHFETTYDNCCMEKVLKDLYKRNNLNQLSFNNYIRTKFGRILLFATQICHIIILTETNINFDSSYLSLFKSLKIIREKYVLRFLPKFVKNSNAGSFLGKDGRLCSPRFLFFFDSCPMGLDCRDELLSKLEFDTEDNIYKMLRNEFIITNNSSVSLFSIPGNKRFVYYNIDNSFRENPLLMSIKLLKNIIDKSSIKEESDEDFDDIRPFKGFGKPLKQLSNVMHQDEQTCNKKRNFQNLLNEHIEEALQSGFDDSMSRFKGKSHFVIPTVKSWFDTFKLLHKIFIENPDNPEFEANDPDYKAYLDNFQRLLDIDEE